MELLERNKGMANSKYEPIYRELKSQIEKNEYPEGSYLPSENILTQIYDCSRNTIRRAISHLVAEGYVQPHHGKGVRVIHQSNQQKANTYDTLAYGMDGYSATVRKYGYEIKSDVIAFCDSIVDETLAEKTGFPSGTEIWFVQRVRSLNGVPKMIDTSYLRKDIVKGLTREDAEKSLFSFYADRLGLEITTIKRDVTIELSTPLDERYLVLDKYKCVAVLTSRSYNQCGVVFEYRKSRNRPDTFKFSIVVTKSVNVPG